MRRLLRRLGLVALVAGVLGVPLAELTIALFGTTVRPLIALNDASEREFWLANADPRDDPALVYGTPLDLRRDYRVTYLFIDADRVIADARHASQQYLLIDPLAGQAPWTSGRLRLVAIVVAGASLVVGLLLVAFTRQKKRLNVPGAPA